MKNTSTLCTSRLEWDLYHLYKKWLTESISDKLEITDKIRSVLSLRSLWWFNEQCMLSNVIKDFLGVYKKYLSDPSQSVQKYIFMNSFVQYMSIPTIKYTKYILSMWKSMWRSFLKLNQSIKLTNKAAYINVVLLSQQCH